MLKFCLLRSVDLVVNSIGITKTDDSFLLNANDMHVSEKSRVVS